MCVARSQPAPVWVLPTGVMCGSSWAVILSTESTLRVIEGLRAGPSTALRQAQGDSSGHALRPDNSRGVRTWCGI